MQRWDDVGCTILWMIDESPCLIKNLFLELVVAGYHVGASLGEQIQYQGILLSLILDIVLNCFL